MAKSSEIECIVIGEKMNFSKENMKNAGYEIGTVFRDLGVAALGGAIVLSKIDGTYWHYAIVGLVLLCLGVFIQLKTKTQ